MYGLKNYCDCKMGKIILILQEEPFISFVNILCNKFYVVLNVSLEKAHLGTKRYYPVITCWNIVP